MLILLTFMGEVDATLDSIHSDIKRIFKKFPSVTVASSCPDAFESASRKME
ncbi:MAG: hypothetical protein OXE94_00195 [Aestuariivita sp.]|nr:hypothetical protein [Aestuariivita sp.]MCY4288055.1 hypothetical protein [Aestuariivita sp.]